MRTRERDEAGLRARVRAWLPDVGLALGLFVALNVLGERVVKGFDVTSAWLSLPGGTLPFRDDVGAGAGATHRESTSTYSENGSGTDVESLTTMMYSGL